MKLEVLELLHAAVAKELLRKIQAGEATAADLSAAAKFLKDNGIDCYAGSNKDVASLAEKMVFPSFDDEGED